MVTDSISDMLTRVRNGLQVRKANVEIPGSKIKTEIAQILKEEGYIEGFEEYKNKKQFQTLKVELKYFNNQPVIQGIDRISRPGLRKYVGKNDIPKVLGGLGIAILSTSQGVMTDKKARHNNVGGEVLCYVW